MNNGPNNTAGGGHAGFDHALRAHHASAVERLSPRTRTQLVQRRNAALRGERVAPAHGVRYAAASLAAICALAISLEFGIMPGPDRPATSTGIASVSATSPDTTMLDEDPEFYAWLASVEAPLMAME